MEELITRIVSATGISEDVARNAVAIILKFLNKDGPAEQMQQIFDALPGAAELVTEREADSKGGGLLGGLGGMVPGMSAMGALNELTSEGLGMSEVQSVVRQLVGYAKEKAGDDAVDEVISKIPGLSQIV
ncbi:DUF2780 domain-containing protein [uncultured Roseibium sp.]|uniref:DUF2780 domain-containing protein n=1 Tax=uncultured Roseibium sp. TaxID=1936171 RepID=UPI002591B161|nr:DUF2780 domain-containing protein [uncultured Roseibium sp.]